VEQLVLTLRGALRKDALEQAAADTMQHHPALRARVLWEGLDRPVQIVHQSLLLDWAYADLRGEQAAVASSVDTFLARDRARGFDLTRPPLLRFTLLRLGTATWHLVLTFHHILADGWSTRLILADLGACYRAHCRGESARLSAPPAYRQYLDWLEMRPEGPATAFWREHLAGLQAPTPIAMPDVQVSVRALGEQRLHLEIDRVDALRQASRVLRVTPNTLVQAAWALVVARYSGESDVLFGSTLAGRPHDLPGVQSMVGLFIETVPSRVRVRRELECATWLQTLQAEQQRAAEYAYCGLGRIRACSELPAGSEVFESLVVFESMPAESPEDSPFGDLELVDEEYLERSNYPLAVLVLPGNEWQVKAIHDRSRFSDDLVCRLLASFDTALAGLAAASPDTLVGRIDALGKAEEQQLLDWGRGPPSQPAGSSWLDLLDAAVARGPDAIALCSGSERLSYRHLDAEATRRARSMNAAGLASGDLVGVPAERTLDRLVSVIALLRAGGVYVPLEMAEPAARLQLIAQKAELRWVLPGWAAGTLGVPVLDYESVPPAAAGAEEPGRPGREDPAYVIHTSGSTGIPRGVLVSHGNLLFSTHARLQHYREPVGAFLLLSSLAFDSSVAGIFWTLATGGTLVLPEAGRQDELEHLLDTAVAARITHLLCVPSLYQLLLTSAEGRLDGVRLAIVAGEACPPRVVREHARRLPGARLYNEYGPTEATVWSTVEAVDLAPGSGSVPIGKPIPGARLRVEGEDGALTPVGVPGELWIAGPMVARGYLNHEQETARRFSRDPLGGDGALRYRSGDLVRWLQDGRLEFIGREDGQVKLRGRRIETGEIESALGAHPQVREAAAVVVHPVGTDKVEGAVLAAFVVTDEVTTSADLKSFLDSRLPHYMVPRCWALLPALPRTGNGKIDYQALRCVQSFPADEPATAPVDDIEVRLVAIWEQVLNRPVVGREDDFFDLGGHSLLAMKLFSAIEREFHRTLPLATIFTRSTVARLAQALRPRGDFASNPNIVTLQEGAGLAPLFCIHCGAGNVFHYRELASRLGVGRPVLGLVPSGLDGHSPLHRSVAEMAECYADWIVAAHPDGPYLLCGYSFGGTVAYDVARRLRARGRDVVFIGLFDTAVYGTLTPTHSLPGHRRRLASLSPVQKLAYIARSARGNANTMLRNTRRRTKRLAQLLPARVFVGIGRPIPVRLQPEFIRELSGRAMQHYVPEPCDADVTVYRQEGGVWEYRDQPDLGWGRFVSEDRLHIVNLPGRHGDMLEDPLVESLAESMRLSLAPY
jgi:amino acid adenylation domain-containing protein